MKKKKKVKERRLKLVLGLGNPGSVYHLSRHNVGYQVIDTLAHDYHIKLNKEVFLVQWGRGKVLEEELILAKPMTFMNLSGEAASYLVEKFNLSPEEILVVHDDMDLSWNRLKLVAKSGPGGHNGVASVIEKLGTEQIPRLKIGISRPLDKDRVSYVLSEFSEEEIKALPEVIRQAKTAIELVLKEGLSRAMSIFNARGKGVEDV